MVLKAEGARAPSEVADDLEPWLEGQGWERYEESEFPPGEQSFERDYYRDGTRGRVPQSHLVSDGGAAAPEELISSTTLEEIE